ncbi:unnamed protein product [Cuscuta campestris]|uniref:Short-chain dehydrogenase/reductase n=2 Tax=Cuscuta sect. Cleistogrammica TaxID=1824901 RepID=A0A484N919_9ASTE|nr:hypothetical protein DM860_017641 [Cuscuta australis]VFQ96738.1 unnamed protein product [Cuscuta campestris]
MNRKDRARERREKRRQEICFLRSIPYSDHQRWWTSDTIAVVTGGNRGIGFEIVRQLGTHGLTVILTSRDTTLGLEAAKFLRDGGLKVEFHQLDIVDPSSIDVFCTWLKEHYGGLDILINNAGVNFNVGSENSVEHAETVIKTNYYGTKNIIKAAIPLVRLSASCGSQIVNVSSRLGRLNGRRNRIGNVELRSKLENLETLSEELIDHTLNTFLEQVKDGTWELRGWPQVFTDYSMSKLGVNALTRLMARELEHSSSGQQKICMNCCCPGWVKTGMTGWEGNILPEEAADTAVWLALHPNLSSVSGKFFAERREIGF